jgi:hypothetical protein
MTVELDTALRDEIVALVLALCDEIAPDLAEPVEVSAGEHALLFGHGAPLPSIALVALVASLEQELDDHYGTYVELADDRAVSRGRSPFRTVGTLADWATELVTAAR